LPNETDPQSLPAPVTFEQSLARLEQIVARLEDGRVDLDDSLSAYEEGVKLLRQCHSLLERAERRIEQLSGVDADGKPVTVPFDDRATISLDETAPSRSRRRSAKKPEAAAVEKPAEAVPGADIDETNTLF
jgi:exodeoxyribonuclease VII small subunit